MTSLRFPLHCLFGSYIQWLDRIPRGLLEQRMAGVTGASRLWTKKWGRPRAQALNPSGKIAGIASKVVIREAWFDTFPGLFIPHPSSLIPHSVNASLDSVE